MAIPNTRFCPKCKQVKQEEVFGLDSFAKNGFRRHCKPCRNLSEVNRRKKKLVKYTYKRPIDKYRDQNLKKYGISNDDYNSMLKRQNYRCSICGIFPILQRLAVDHCHISGKVRELLCTKCNTGLGAMRDDIDILNAAIEYLKKHSNETKG